MAKLIVEEGGKRRRFRLNPGKLTIGSGEEATLHLTSQGVARIHAVLVFKDGAVTIEPEAGVAPLKVGGKSHSAGFKLAPGQSVAIGGARISIEAEEGEVKAGPARPASRSSQGLRAPQASGSRASRSRASDDAATPTRSRHRKAKPSVPTGLVVGLGLVGAFIVVQLMSGWADSASVRAFEPMGSKGKIEEKLKGEDYKGILAELDWVDKNRAELSVEWRSYFDGKRKEAEGMRAEAQLYARNTTGTKWFATQLEKFQSSYLKGNTRPEARVFLKRIAQFRSDYPRHPKLGWCDRMAVRYADIAKLNEPPTMEDLAFEVKTLTWARPRDYKKSFELLEAFLLTASGSDQSVAKALIQEKISERKEFFDDRILQAAYYWDNKEPNKAVGQLAQLVATIGDSSMEDQAADLLLKIPGLDGYLRSYQRDRVSTFEALMDHGSLRAYAESNNVL
ncbi:MAG: hypothetical protein CMJ98_01005 [Planctomycetes bacterium]|jgi:hypothetical protein|nr:hypothetical protein [Planctomycetota bacterium]MBV21289.1 hypothetical protein [Planctomycetaceae bacterium]HJM58633.1 FHA domain-containing protein [Planctomycetota bacterium]